MSGPSTVHGQPSTADHVVVALASLVAGAAAGAAVLGVGVFLFRVTASPAAGDPPPHAVIQGAVLVALALGASVAWRSARALPDEWRRGVTAAIGAFAGLLLGALTAPLDMLGGPGVLLAFAVVMTAAAWRAARAARRAERG